jgi:hypothetical protein
MSKFQEIFFSLDAAVRCAVESHPNEETIIIQSNGRFYVENDQGVMIRSWEREIYSGLGISAKRLLTARKV